ncbi:MAG: hypothetical protein KGL23_00745 [Acidobacteriota bacterium]|nr:hypothetical protein [Acidobacteriota bacterium]MDE3145948.1 hypothetical protein [Acidobacteriota bacterium]
MDPERVLNANTTPTAITTSPVQLPKMSSTTPPATTRALIMARCQGFAWNII